jgi:hypothetical protein
MAAAGAGPGAAGAAPTPRAAARQVHIGRSDGRLYSTQEIISRSKTAANQVGEPIPEEWDQIADPETRAKMIQWKVVIGDGLSEELAWPRGKSPWHAGSSPSPELDRRLTEGLRCTIPACLPRTLLS